MYSISSVSGFASIIVIAIYLRYNEINRKIYNQMIFNIAVCDLIIAVGTFLGVPEDDSILCYIQSPMVNIGQVAQIFWVTVLAYYLYFILSNSTATLQTTEFLVSKRVYVLTYGLATFVSLIPLTTVPIGKMDGGWCYFKEPAHNKWTLDLWYVISIFGWLYVSIMFYIYLIWYVYVKLYRQAEGGIPVSSSVQKAALKIIWYPIILMITYFMVTLYLFWLTVDKKTNLTLVGFIGLNTQLGQGLFDCIAFLYTTPRARTLVIEDLRTLWRGGECEKRRAFDSTDSYMSRGNGRQLLSAFSGYQRNSDQSGSGRSLFGHAMNPIQSHPSTRSCSSQGSSDL